MRRFALWLALLHATSAGGLAVQGCADEQSNRQPRSASTVAGIATPPVGPFPRGTPNPAHSPDPTKVGPALTLLAPDRGAQVSTPTVDVRLRAEDPDGVSAVLIGGAAATPAGPSEWTAPVALTPGMNLISLEGVDALGNRSTAYVSVVQGQFQPDDQMLTGSLGLSLTQGGLDRVADIAEQQTQTFNLYSLIAGHNPLVTNFMLKVNASGLAHDPLQYRASGTPSGIEVVVDVDNVLLETEVEVIGWTLTRANITADRATLRATATVSQAAFTGTGVGKRALGLEIDQITVDSTNFQVKTPSGALNLILLPFQGMLKNMVEGKLKDMLLDVVDSELSKSLAGLDVPLTVTIPDLLKLGGSPRDMDLMFQVDGALGFSGVGLGLAGGLRVTPAQPAAGVSRQVLRSGLVVQPQVLGPEAFSLSLTSDAVNAMLHAVYATGGVKILLDGTNPPPGLTMPLNVRMLYPFLPPVRDVAPDPNTPIVIEVELAAAPLARLAGPQTLPYGASIGEAKIRVLIDYMDGGPRADLFTLYAAVDAGGDMSLTATELKITALDLSNLRVDVTEEPLVDLADQEIEDFVEQALPTLANQFVRQLPAMPIPGLPLGLQLSSARLEVQQDLLRIHGDL